MPVEILRYVAKSRSQTRILTLTSASASASAVKSSCDAVPAQGVYNKGRNSSITLPESRTRRRSLSGEVSGQEMPRYSRSARHMLVWNGCHVGCGRACPDCKNRRRTWAEWGSGRMARQAYLVESTSDPGLSDNSVPHPTPRLVPAWNHIFNYFIACLCVLLVLVCKTSRGSVQKFLTDAKQNDSMTTCTCAPSRVLAIRRFLPPIPPFRCRCRLVNSPLAGRRDATARVDSSSPKPTTSK